MKYLRDMFSSLPSALATQIFGYAQSVHDASQEIFKEARVHLTDDLQQKLVFLAGVKKLYTIIDSNYWLIDNSGKLLSGMGTNDVYIGSVDFSRGSEYFSQLDKMRRDLTEILSKFNILHFVEDAGYVEIVQALADGHEYI